MAVPRLRVPPASPPGTTLRQASDEVELYHRTYTTLLRSSGETRLRVLEPSHAAMGSSLHALAHDMEVPDLGAFLYSLRRLPRDLAGERDRHRAGVGGLRSRGDRADRGLGGRRGPRPSEALVRLRTWDGRRPARFHLGSRRRDPDARGLPARVEQAAHAADLGRPARGAGAAGPGRGRRRHGRGLEARARDVARRARRVRGRGPHTQAQPAAADARRLAVRVRAADAPLVGAGAHDADRPGPLGPADVLRLLEPALAREPRHDLRGRERGRDRRLRGAAARTT